MLQAIKLSSHNIESPRLYNICMYLHTSILPIQIHGSIQGYYARVQRSRHALMRCYTTPSRWTDGCINMCPYSLYELNTQIGLLRLRPTLKSHHNAAICYAIKVDRHIWLASIYIHTLLIKIFIIYRKIPFSVTLQNK